MKQGFRAKRPRCADAAAPLIVHVLFSLDVGGLERLLVDLINRSPANFRHAIICLTDYSGLGEALSDKAACFALHKRQGKDVGMYWRLWRLLRQLKPAIVQTYNIGCIDANFLAWLAGVPCRLHAEHGRTADDPDGKNRRYKLLRRSLQPFIHYYITVSRQLAGWLTDSVGIRRSKVLHIYNGIDLERYRPEAKTLPWPAEFAQDSLVIGTVGRLDPVKDQQTLLRAFKLAADRYPREMADCRLAIIGEGPARQSLENEIDRLQLNAKVWLAGLRDDVPALLAALDIFVLPSIAEGIPLTALEAMATGRPVIATAVGGVPEVVISGECGLLVPASNPRELADALVAYIRDPALRARHGAAARARVEANFDIAKMDEQYFSLYARMADKAGAGRRQIDSRCRMR
jgi:sugar transferase (PEP-CTERM/EpsH1 system associated)